MSSDTSSTKNILQRLHEINGVIKLKGKDYVLMQGLLFLAHEHGLESIETSVQQLDYERKFCLVQSVIRGTRGSFITHGDADDTNLNDQMLTAFIRMAETRAIARGLRLYTGIGMTAKDELPSEMLPENEHEPDPERLPSKKKADGPEVKLISKKQKDLILRLCAEKGMTPGQVDQRMKENDSYQCTLSELTMDQASEVIDSMIGGKNG